MYVGQYYALRTLARILWKKEPTNSPFNIVHETELGVEYQIIRALELTVAYSWMKRTDTINAPYPIHDGQLSVFNYSLIIKNGIF